MLRHQPRARADGAARRERPVRGPRGDTRPSRGERPGVARPGVSLGRGRSVGGGPAGPATPSSWPGMRAVPPAEAEDSVRPVLVLSRDAWAERMAFADTYPSSGYARMSDRADDDETIRPGDACSTTQGLSGTSVGPHIHNNCCALFYTVQPARQITRNASAYNEHEKRQRT